MMQPRACFMRKRSSTSSGSGISAHSATISAAVAIPTVIPAAIPPLSRPPPSRAPTRRASLTSARARWRRQSRCGLWVALQSGAVLAGRS
eukprot:5181504-Prymnesium_polylepis.1